ncbi:MAG: hypothetical protein HY823_00355 [Acidobacteria bacterium]|nr:hypothetical protein [Acidobacteriota bacterium]
MRLFQRSTLPWAALSAILVLPLGAQSGLLVPTSTGRPDPAVLSLREMAVELGIARGYARVQVRQVFENHTSSVQEGTYRFALPPSAAVGDFAVWDGLMRIPGVILEKQRARAIYQELTRQRIDPGLLQQGEEEGGAPGEAAPSSRPSGAALFSVTVAPIPPMATKRLELQFHQEVPLIGGTGEFRLVLRPPDGEAPVAGTFQVRIQLDDARFEAVPTGLPLTPSGTGATFTGSKVRLDRDLVFRIKPKDGAPLRLSAFRNPEGRLPDGLALAPWERPTEIPPEKDGYFLLEAMPPPAQAPRNAGSPSTAARPTPGQALAILFDTSLGHRWGGLEAAYGQLVRMLGSLRPEDRFVLIPFDRRPAGGTKLQPATPMAIESELATLRNRSLGPGADVPKALAAARQLLGGQGRILLLTSGQGLASSKALKESAGPLALFTFITTGQAHEAFQSASAMVLTSTSTEIETDLFFQRLLAPGSPESKAARKSAGDAPFTVTGGNPRLRHIYPVMLHPMEPGALSGWVGRYETPLAEARFEWPSPLFPGGRATLQASLPEKALEARDLPRRWARARVDDLLARIESEGERREWVDEIILLSKRYKFVTPYTAFLAAPRSLLRPRRIQPGDPVLRVECDPGTSSATALFPFGLKLDLARRHGTNVWEGRFLVPEGFPDGRYPVRILLRARGGATVTETKHFILDGQAPVIHPELPGSARAGELLRVQVRTDADVVLLTARIGDAPPVPLRWDPESKRSVGLLRIPERLTGTQELLFEAVDGAKNHGFGRALLEVRP